MKLCIDDLRKVFNLEVLAGEEKLTNPVKVYGLNRAGLELSGYFEEGEKAMRIILMSTKESRYIMHFSEEEREDKYRKLAASEVPAIIITSKFEDEATILKVAKETNTPLFKTDVKSTSDFTQLILDYMDNYFAPTIEQHGSLVNIFGKGVFLTGESGIGKSEITMELVRKNHLFVGDDRIIFTRKANKVYGRSHPILKNLVEVRGIGILDIAKTDGHQLILDESTIDVIVELHEFKKDGVDVSERLGNEFEHKEILGNQIPFLNIPVSSGRNVSNIIEMAVAKLKLVESGEYEEPSSLLERRIKEFNDHDK